MSLTIRGRLIVGFSLMAGFMAAYGLYDAYETTQLRETLRRTQGKATLLARCQNALWELRYGFPQFLVFTDAESRQRITQGEPALYRTFDDNIGAFASSDGLTPEEVEGARAVQLAFERYKTARPHWFQLIAQGRMDEATEWRAATTTPFGAATVRAVAQLVDASGRQDALRLERLTREAQLRHAIAAAVLLFGALLTAWIVVRSVHRPLGRLQGTIARVAEGDLRARTHLGSRDELGQLADSFDRLLDDHLSALDRVQSENDELTRSMQALVEAEQRVEAGEHLMRVMADNMPVRLAYWDASLRCQFANRRYCEVLGVEREQLLGASRDARVFQGEDTLRLEPEHVAAALGGVVRQVEQDARDADGRETAWIVHYLPHFVAGEVAGFFTVAQDVTELRRARDAAVAASQAKSRFLSSMSHEIRTPMNAVVGMLSLLQLTPLDSRQKDYADKAEGAARSLLSLLNDILDFSKIEAGRMQLEPRPFSLDALLNDLSTILAGAVGRKQLEVLYDIDPRIPDRLVADDMRLRQILINLGGNAVKFTDTGEVVVQLRLVAAGTGAIRVEFAVRDTGIGITPEQSSRLFDDYAQASGEIARAFGGTGLGLSICRRLAAMMGSELHVQSTPGQGSRFSFELLLPLATPVAEAVDTLPVERVLIVDDNVVARESLAAIAVAQGWKPEAVASGEEALQRLETGGTRYDAIFVDWNMPGLDGWETSLRIRELQAGQDPHLLLMLTAYGREMLSRRPAAEQALVDGYLVKPVTGSMVQAALREALGAQRREATEPRADQPLAGIRLLLVEDNVVNQQIADELLTREGAQIEIVGDGQQAIERLSRGPRPDLVLMDVLMPVMGGLEATRIIRGALGLRDLPVLAMTANALDTDRDQCLAAGMDGHVGKPFVLEDLVRLIRHHVDGGAQDRAGTGGPAPGHDALEHLPLWDREQALTVLGGRPELLERIVGVFAEDLRRMLAALRDRPTDAELLRCFHTLKASAGGVGASRLAEVAAQAELRARRDPAAAGEAVPAVLAVADATLAVLA
ncbi:MAG TPA: response regulator [Ramlibacter sp.]|uniref:hybrid sensor histidine kinase/response regulator n=1 Tax=Ramlibacter sp. TaxID=1917967 RepID=UPI002D75AD55|nr:response regulator [Ramlibacter sp.]HZY17972.1 response regulator [Ramlibacter sp.]